MLAASRRAGITLVELLVVIGIVGLIASLLLPAVQASRESARRLHCLNNLRQLGIALLNYESAWAMFPPAPMSYRVRPKPLPRLAYYSAHSAILRELDQVPLHNSINFSVPTARLGDFAAEGANLSAAAQVVACFLCPSDAGVLEAAYGPNNYRANGGVCGYCEDGRMDGAFTYSGTRPANFTDGLSSTLAFSEKLLGTGTSGKYEAARDWILAMPGSPNGRKMSADAWVSYCAQRSLPADLAAVKSDAGQSWMLGGCAQTQFLVSAAPNSTAPDCGTESAGGVGVFAARSRHPGGVNAITADGAARFYNSSIDPHTWRALGTRSGGEIASSP